LQEGDQWSVAHYVVYRLTLQNIPVEERDGEMFYSKIGLEKVRQFINECVLAYNETHVHKMDYESIAELAGSMREQDKKDFQRLVAFQENT
jgi:hypothetical protein